MSINLIGRKLSFGGDDFDFTAIDDQTGQSNSTANATATGTLPAKPTATAHNDAVTPGTSIPLTTLFSYSAAAGDTIVGFDVEETSNNGGYLTDNGVKQSPEVLYGSGEFGIPISQISQWAFVAGPAGTSDAIGFNVDDQYGQFNSTVTATVTGQLPAKPTATAHNDAVTPGTSIPLTTLFSYSAAAGDTIVGFDVEETSNNGGYLTDNGVKQSPEVLYGSGEFGIPISQISQWAFVAGPAGTSDTIGFNVDDQYGQFNSTVTATATANAALPAKPTATAHNDTVASGTSIPLTTLFSYSAAAGDTIIGFDVEETSNNGGYLTDNGVKQSPEVLYGSGEFGIPISQISQWAFVAGPAGTSDTIGFNVDDQYGQFNPTVSATVTSSGGGGGSSKQGIDFQDAASLSAAQVAQKGYNFVINYLGTSSSNYLTSAEANSDIAAGLQICSVYEVTIRNGVDYNPNIAANIPGYFAHCLDNFGYTDGTNAYNYAHNVLNQSAGSAIYFAIDASAATSSTEMADVINYFQGIEQAFDDLSGGNPIYKIGVYGGGDVLDTIYDSGLAQYKWLADAPSWDGSAGYTNYTIQQYDNGDITTFPGVSVDHDVTNGSNFGQWGATKVASPVDYDFNGDGYADILLQSAGGQIEYANMAGGSFQNIVSVTNVPGWNVVGQGNISGGADSDIVIQNGSQIAYVNLVNGGFSSFVPIGNPTGYVVVGVGDIAGNHFADVVIQNPTTDEVGYANMDNGVFNNWFSVADPVGWKAVAVADINDDGHADIVIQNNTTGEVGYANMSNGTLNGFVSLGEPLGYNVVGAGDVNGLGDADVVVQNPTNGSIGYANMINGAVSGWVSIGDPAGWSVIAVEDILGNGYDDIVIESNSNSQIAYANMTGGSFQGWVGITTVPGFTGKTGPGSGSAASSAPELQTSDAATQTSVQTDDLAAANSNAFAGQDAAASNGGTVSGITMQDPGPQNGFAVNGITVEDPGPQNGGTVNGITMQDPGPQSCFAVNGITVEDPGSQNGGTVSGITMQDPRPQNGVTVSGIKMQDPGPQNGGAVSSMFDPTAAYGSLLSAFGVLDPGTTSAGAVTGSGQNDQGSASWLTEGTLPGGTSVGDNQDLNSSSTAFVITADSLQHALKPGT